MKYEDYISVTEGFPTPDISFKDISPLLANPEALKSISEEMAQHVKDSGATLVIGPEARGFVLGAPVALEAGVGFAMARKKGKLPGETLSKTYALEYGTDTIELPKFAIEKGTKVALVDDLLATGGTLVALKELVEEVGGEVVLIMTLIELEDLKGRYTLGDAPYITFIKYPH